MKKIISLIMCLCMLGASAVHASEPVKILLNNEEVKVDSPAFIENNRTMVPVRAIFEAIGANVQWDEDTKTVLMLRQKGDEATSVVLQIGLNNAFVNNESIALDSPAKIVNNRTFVPLRFIIEAFDENISWDGDTRTVSIVTE